MKLKYCCSKVLFGDFVFSLTIYSTKSGQEHELNTIRLSTMVVMHISQTLSDACAEIVEGF